MEHQDWSMYDEVMAWEAENEDKTKCLHCGTVWESYRSALTCPCWDDDSRDEKIDIHNHVARRIRELRVSRKDGLKVAAEKCNMSISRYNRLELGQGDITVRNLSRIADGYKVKLNYFTRGL